MKSTGQRMLAASMLLAVGGCAGSPPILASRLACSSLIPAEWADGVGSAPFPADVPFPAADAPAAVQLDAAQAALKEWTGFGVAQTGQLDKADGRTRDAIGIMTRCEARDLAAIEASRKRWWQIWK